MKRNGKLCQIAFGQALGLAGYCGLVGLVFWRGSQWFGKVPNFWGPFLMLLLLTASALICALMALGYPAWLLWQKKQADKAIKLVVYTGLWLIGLLLAYMLGLLWFRAIG